MSKMTFVVDFKDGEEPPIDAGTQLLGGRVCAAAFYDYREDYFSEQDTEIIVAALDSYIRHNPEVDPDIYRKLLLVSY